VPDFRVAAGTGAAFLLWLACEVVAAQGPTSATRIEITHLLAHLEHSGCEFERNGSWHGGKKAAAHLQKKYAYLLNKELVPTADAFIDRAASKSSVSGKPYRVRCADQRIVESRSWFTSELASWRKSHR